MESLERLKEDIVFEDDIRGFRLTFHSTWGLFSPRAIDTGTRLLLERIEVNEGDDCLDLGCGYAPIGLAMARLSKTGTVYMADKDFVAVEFAKKNARLNRIERCEFAVSNGCEQLPEIRFDVIASNLPSNTGRELLQILLLEAHERLKPGGRLYLVTVNGLRDAIKRYLREYFSNYEKVKQGKAHAVAMATRLA